MQRLIAFRIVFSDSMKVSASIIALSISFPYILYQKIQVRKSCPESLLAFEVERNRLTQKKPNVQGGWRAWLNLCVTSLDCDDQMFGQTLSYMLLWNFFLVCFKNEISSLLAVACSGLIWDLSSQTRDWTWAHQWKHWILTPRPQGTPWVHFFQKWLTFTIIWF